MAKLSRNQQLAHTITVDAGSTAQSTQNGAAPAISNYAVSVNGQVIDNIWPLDIPASGTGAAALVSATAPTASLIKQLNLTSLRLPGGTVSDAFIWDGSGHGTNGGTATPTQAVWATSAPSTPTTYAGTGYIGGNPNTTYTHTDYYLMCNSLKAANPNARAFITVNYGTGPGAGTAAPYTAQSGQPALAANWVKDANVTNNFGVVYWAIGNEVYGYSYEPNNWPYWGTSTSHTNDGPNGTQYGATAKTFISQMKAAAVSPSPAIKVGVSIDGTKFTSPSGTVTAPGSYTCSATGDPWNFALLTELSTNTTGTYATPTSGYDANIARGGAAVQPDWIDFHWYAFNTGGGASLSESVILNIHNQIPNLMASLRKMLQTIWPSTYKNTEIHIGELNMCPYDIPKFTGEMVNAFFLVNCYMTFFIEGATSVHWWALRNAFDKLTNHPTANMSTLYDPSGNTGSLGGAYGADYGIVTYDDNGSNSQYEASQALPTWTSHAGQNQPYPTFFGLQAVGQACQPGSTILPTTYPYPGVTVYGTKQTSGGVTLLILNTNHTISYTITPNILNNTHTFNSATMTTFSGTTAANMGTQPPGTNANTVKTLPIMNNTTIVTVPAYSITTVVMV